jgi:hypothetical protein
MWLELMKRRRDLRDLTTDGKVILNCFIKIEYGDVNPLGSGLCELPGTINVREMPHPDELFVSGIF